MFPLRVFENIHYDQLFEKEMSIEAQIHPCCDVCGHLFCSTYSARYYLYLGLCNRAVIGWDPAKMLLLKGVSRVTDILQPQTPPGQ